MPVAVAIAVRYMIMAGVQLGLWWALEKYALPLINNAISALMQLFGVPRETAEDIMANEVLLAFESVGIFAATLSTKLPIKVAERLGFTTKGWTKRTLPSKVTQQTQKLPKGVTASPAISQAEAAIVAETVAVYRGISLQKVGALTGIISAAISVPTLVFIAIAQYIDYANWEGPYQGTFQKILALFGVHPDNPLPSSRVVSSDIWKKISATIQQLQPRTLYFPYSKKRLEYNQANLAALVDEVAANIIKEGGTASFKNVMGIVLPLIALTPAAERTPTVFPTTAPTAPGAVAATSVPLTKVFTGVLAQGKLGADIPFSARQDDLIESDSELKEAAANNLSATLVALPGQLSYEIKIVSSVITKDGFKQTGKPVQVPSGTNRDGSTKYKTVVSKFAVMDIYLVNEKGTRTKVRSIVLGPTDVLKFNPTMGQLTQLALDIKQSVVTSDIGEVREVAQQTTRASSPTAADRRAAIAALPPPLIEDGVYITNPGYDGPGKNKIYNLGGVRVKATTECEAAAYLYKYGIRVPKATAKYCQLPDDATESVSFAAAPPLVAGRRPPDDPANKYNTDTGELNPNYNPSAAPSPTTATASICSAKTLYELSVAQGVRLPTVAERAPDYERLGLGQAAFYTGTAEQNIKLLAALKRELGCPNA